MLKFYIFMGDRNWQGGPILAAKIGPGGPVLAADRFFRYSTIIVVRVAHRFLFLFVWWRKRDLHQFTSMHAWLCIFFGPDQTDQTEGIKFGPDRTRFA